MRLKKNVFGYINFSIGTLIMSVYLYTLFVSLFKSFEEKAGKRILFMGIKMSYINAALLFIVSLALVFLLYFVKSKITVRPFKASGLVYGIVYWCLFAGLLSYGFVVRLMNMGVLKKWDSIKNYTESVSKPGYWQVLIDLFYGKDVAFDNFFHKAYSFVTALFLRIFGDTLTVPVGLNLVLYMVSCILLFFSIRFIFGKVPALVTFAALMLSKAPVAFLFEITGFNMFFLAASLLIFLVAYFLDVFTSTKPVMCYIVSFVTILLVVIINHFAFKPFEPVFSFDLSVLNFRPSENIYISILLVILALAGLYAFFKNSFDEISFANILLVLLLLILMFDYSANNTYLFAIMSFCIFAGIGADNLLFRHYKSVPVKEALGEYDSDIPEEFLANTAEASVASVPLTPVETPIFDEEPVEESVKDEELVKAEEPVKAQEPVKAEESAQVAEPAPAVADVPKAEDKPAESPVKREVPKFFETPLPMPKKHVKKTLDYTFEPSPELMKYDIEISPDDDFDIK